ncbi:uncharacterized protein LOC133834861 [Humulus lupulus]|uniref:uncharacterized protein LOC133834861 n=1 Tax=Humulus lupulus TaxID=3486 RepID=UPI002B402EC0|nr:uncharacterized protein LOC133834861 [Humulus lupulus]
MARSGGVQTRKNANRSNSNEDSNQFSVLDDHSRSHNDDPRRPYYLSTSDHPGANVVPKILTGSNNYITWRRSMMVALLARNKVQFVNGKLPQPYEEDEDFDMWNRCNSLVISWMLHVVTPNIVDSIMYMETTSAIWDELQE